MKKSNDIKVFISNRDSICDECKEKLGRRAWITGWEMAAAVCEAGGLGTIAAATMEPQELIESIREIRKVTDRPFAVNIPLKLPTAHGEEKTSGKGRALY